MRKSIQLIRQVEHHRNGVTGVPFHAVLFRSSDGEDLLAIVFAELGEVAVLCPAKLAADGVTFGANSYRGDSFEAELRAAIAAEA